MGSDVCASVVVLREGERLGPAELGLMATVGVTKVEVYRRPHVAVLSTGNEVGPIVFKLAPRTVRTPFVCTCAHTCVIYIGSGCVLEGWPTGEVSVCVWACIGVSGWMHVCKYLVLHVCPQVVEPGQALQAGQIYDSNKTTLMATLREQGFDCHDAGLAEDE